MKRGEWAAHQLEVNLSAEWKLEEKDSNLLYFLGFRMTVETTRGSKPTRYFSTHQARYLKTRHKIWSAHIHVPCEAAGGGKAG